MDTAVVCADTGSVDITTASGTGGGRGIEVGSLLSTQRSNLLEYYYYNLLEYYYYKDL